MEHFNKLTPAEAERLAILLEEMGEAQQAIGKILRHGYEGRPPFGGETNKEALERELGDVVYALTLLGASRDLNEIAIYEYAKAKNLSKSTYLHHT